MSYLVIAAVVCLVSFAWAMQFHFSRAGRFTPGMWVTTVAGFVTSGIQIAGLVRHADGFPSIAVGLYAISAMLFWLAVFATRGARLAACFQGRTALRLVREGPYRWIRHPFYTAYSLNWLAGFAATLWWPAALACLAMIAIYLRAAREEELAWLSSEGWEEYAAYVRETGGFVPRLPRIGRCRST